ncbi:CHASE domain-containing protein [Schlegelella sp. S2-27]|uniref:CHASE domain-containing protein n=1 Tax=Caldimonas mangrovi TaxID=2944811 RepID=A0ABT0YV53_9BURK|nr:CHASE domain-containing protein [Caldimonas mangrovi]MCM5682483.1 CHASE domain-containing protein [Caldimonas mangrovi]
MFQPTADRTFALLPLLALLCGLALTAGAGWVTSDAERVSERARFERRADDVVQAVQEGMRDHEKLVLAAAGLIAAQPDVTRKQWREFAEALNLEARYPGVQGLGYARRTPAAELIGHKLQVRAEGFPEYDVLPPGQRDEYYPIVYLEPFYGRNLRAFGYDMYSEPVRRAAMQLARDTGLPALSGRVHLVQETEQAPQPGALLYLPVYRKDAPVHSVEQRRREIVGFVYSPYRMDDTMRAIIGGTAGGLAIELYDGDAGTSDAPLFADGLLEHWASPFARTRQIVSGQRFWTLRITAKPAFFVAAGASRTALVVGAGALASVLAAALMAALVDRRRHAVKLAEEMGLAHRDDEARIRAVIENTADAIVTVDRMGRICDVNRAAELIFGHPRDRLIGQSARVLVPERLRAQSDALYAQADPPRRMRVEWTGLRSDGREITVRLSMERTEIQGRTQFIWLVSDISEQRQAERVAQEAHQLRQAILEHTPLCTFTVDANGVITSINPAGVRLLGYGAEELVGLRTPLLFHDPEEITARADQLSAESASAVAPGFDVLVALARCGRAEERQWTYIRRDGARVPVELVTGALQDTQGAVFGFHFIAHDITEHARVRQHVESMATHDALTGLPNRRLMADRAVQCIGHARRTGKPFALLLLDLDGFKQVNDTFGHATGDEVLKAVAHALSDCVRAIDTIARLGGDEFVVLLHGPITADEAEAVADKIVARLDGGVAACRQRLQVTGSIGIALWSVHGADLDSLLAAADAAMYRAKQSGRNAWRPAVTAT